MFVFSEQIHQSGVCQGMEKLIWAWFFVCPQLSELFGLSEPQLPRGTQGGDITRYVDSSQHRCIHCKWEVTMSPWCGEWQYKQLTFMDCLLCARCWAQHIACSVAFDPYTIPMGHVYYCPVSLLIKSRLREAWRVPRSHSQEVGEPELRPSHLTNRADSLSHGADVYLQIFWELTP